MNKCAPRSFPPMGGSLWRFFLISVKLILTEHGSLISKNVWGVLIDRAHLGFYASLFQDLARTTGM